jgi:hypothetical protein
MLTKVAARPRANSGADGSWNIWSGGPATIMGVGIMLPLVTAVTLLPKPDVAVVMVVVVVVALTSAVA